MADVRFDFMLHGMADIRVLLLDDHRAFLEALAESLDAHCGVDVVASTTSPAECLALAARLRPDVALLDLVLPDGDGIETGAALRAAHPEVALVAVTAVDQVAPAVRALRAGFTGWVPKDAGIAELLGVVTGVVRGETCFPGLLLTQVLQDVLAEQESARERQEALAVLTRRERDVLRCMTRGAGRREIASALYISENTVRTHVQNILTKLGVHSSLSAMVLARQAGLVDDDPYPVEPPAATALSRQRAPRGAAAAGPGARARAE